MNKLIFHKFRVFFILFSFLALTSFVAVHKFYISVTQIEYIKEKQTLQIISRVFIDDIESVINERYGTSFRLDPTKEQPEIRSYIAKYVKQKLSINVNQQEKPINFLGMEYENDLLLCYMEVVEVPDLIAIQIENTLLMDMFDNQQNIVHVKVNDDRKSIVLQHDEIKGMLNFGE